MCKTLIISLFLFLILSPTSWAQKKSNKEILLTLSVLPLADKTGSEDYEYLSKAIATAINDRLRQTFKYKPYKNSRTEYFMKSILRREGKEWIEMDGSHLLALAEREFIDVLIHGEYLGIGVNEKGNINKMLVRVGVFLGLEKRTYWIDDEVSLDTSLFLVVEEITDDLVSEVDRLLGGRSGAESHKALIRYKKHKDSGINDQLENEMEDFSDYAADKRNLDFLSMRDFQNNYIEKNPKSRKADISKRNVLRKWMRYYNILNLLELEVKNEDILITLDAIGRGKRTKKYKLGISGGEKKEAWSRLARGFREGLSPEEKAGKKKQKRSLTVKNLQARANVARPEFGLRLGSHLSSGEADSLSGFSLDIFYTAPLSLLSSALGFPDILYSSYLPDLHIFGTLENYDAAYNSIDFKSPFVRASFMFGFLYSLNFPLLLGKSHLFKAGATWGVAFESVKFKNEESEAEVGSETGIASGGYLLLGYGYHLTDIRISVFFRLLFGPDAGQTLLGPGFSIGLGIPLKFE